jgi:D-sedoheptulose 7-phosphate isomerase
MAIDRDRARARIDSHLADVRQALDSLPSERLVDLVELVISKGSSGHTVYIAGNGGSAATASHMACDLSKAGETGDGATKRRLRVAPLADNTSRMTAIANDDGYRWVFARQLESLADPGDLLIVISASGNSENVVEAVRSARSMGVSTVGILGFGGGVLRDLVDLAIVVVSDEYGPVEDAHLALNHALSEAVRATVGSQLGPGRRSSPELVSRADGPGR